MLRLGSENLASRGKVELGGPILEGVLVADTPVDCAAKIQRETAAWARVIRGCKLTAD